MSASGSGMGVLGTAMIGYRRQPSAGGFQFRVGFSPLFGNGLGLDSNNRDPAKLGVLPWFYLSLGATF